MKTRVAIGCMVMLAAGANAGLVAYWDFDEGSGQTAADASPNGYNFTLGNDGTVEDVDPVWTTAGKFGNALDFNGGQYDRARGSTSTDFNLNGSWSLSWWQNLDGATWASTLGKGDRYQGGNPDRGYLFYTHLTTLEPTLETLFTAVNLANGDGIETGSFYHLVVTYDGVNNRMNSYVNGVQKLDNFWPAYNGTQAWNTFPANVNTSQLILGWGIDGRIDDKAYFNEELTEGKARSIYTADAAGYAYDLGKMMQIWDAHDAQESVSIDGRVWHYADSLPGTFSVGDTYQYERKYYIALTATTGMKTPRVLAYWDFDEGVGQTAADATGNGYDFTLGNDGTGEAIDPAWTTGKFGNALDFSGTTSTHATGSTSTEFNLNGSWSLSYWQMLYVEGAWQDVLGKNAGERYYGNPDRGYLFGTRWNNLEPWMQTLGTEVNLGNGTGTAMGLFHHVVVTYDGVNNIMNTYLNGVKKLDGFEPKYNGTTAWNAYPENTNTSALLLGWNMDGRIDDMAYFSEELTEGKARSIHTVVEAGFSYDLGKMMDLWDAFDAQQSVHIDGDTWDYAPALPGSFSVGDTYAQGSRRYVALTATTGMAWSPRGTIVLLK